MTRKLSTVLLAVLALVSSVCFAQSSLMTRHTRAEVTSHIAPLVGHLSSPQKLELVLVLQHRNQETLINS